MQRPKRLKKANLHTHAWGPIYSEFHTFNYLLYFTLEACFDSDEPNRHGLSPYYSEKYSFMNSDIA